MCLFQNKEERLFYNELADMAGVAPDEAKRVVDAYKEKIGITGDAEETESDE